MWVAATTTAAHLLMEGVDALRFVEWNQRLAQEVFVLLFERESKTVDDRPQYFQEL